jgi:hypothetical protein
MKSAVAILVVTMLMTVSVEAQEPIPVGGEFQVNTYTTDGQKTPAVALDSEGAFVAVWESYKQDGSNWSIQGQRYSESGNPLGGEFQINEYTTDDQEKPAVASDGAGNFVVVWTSKSQDGSFNSVQGRHYDADGVPFAGEFQVNTYTTGNQAQTAVASADSGEFVVVWASYGQDGWGWSIQGQRYDSDGIPLAGEFQANTHTTTHQHYPAVAMNGDGDFMVVWQSHSQDGSDNSIQGQLYDSDAVPLGTEFQVNSYTTYHQKFPAVAAAETGNFVVAWQSELQDGSEFGIHAQLYDSDGALLGGEFQVNSYSTSSQDRPAVAAATDGSFMVTWSGQGPDSLGRDIQARWYDSVGTPVGIEFQVNSSVGGVHGTPAVAASDKYDFAILWDSNNQDGSGDSVHGQRFAISVFTDGFESGDTTAWSSTVQ